MTLSSITITRLEKAAMDNGFDLEIDHATDWLQFGSTQTSMRIWLGAVGESLFLVGASRADVLSALAEFGIPVSKPPPVGAAGVRGLTDMGELHVLLRRAFQLSRTLPDELLRVFETEAASLPRGTEAERLVVQRVGQDVFRRGLLEYWDRRCAITDLAEPELLRASHIKPWADCQNDAERLDVFNGILLAPHLDAAFDRGFITVAVNGGVVVWDKLSESARKIVGLDRPLRVRALHQGHERFLAWHRSLVFRGSHGSSPP